MKSFLGVSATLFAAASAHSWLGCVDYDNSEILDWMKANSTNNVIVDPGMPWFAYNCKAYPRSLEAGGNWIEQSTNYVWNIAAQSFNMGPSKPADTHACHPNQRAPTYLDGAPMKTAAPGSSFKLFYGGNGHGRGANAGGTSNPNPLGPGTVSVYWKGAPEQEIVDISEFTKENLLQANGFADESFMYPADPNIKTPNEGLVDKGFWQTVKLPADIAPGRHMMVWVWTYAGSDAPQWSTCFDIMVEGDAAKSTSDYTKPAADAVSNVVAAAAPAADYAAPATTPAPVAPQAVYEGVVETVWETVDVWTTVWDKSKRSHMRQFKP